MNQVGIKISGRIINNLRYTDDTALMAESEDKLESLEKGERGEWKSWFETKGQLDHFLRGEEITEA